MIYPKILYDIVRYRITSYPNSTKMFVPFGLLLGLEQTILSYHTFIFLIFLSLSLSYLILIFLILSLPSYLILILSLSSYLILIFLIFIVIILSLSPYLMLIFLILSLLKAWSQSFRVQASSWLGDVLFGSELARSCVPGLGLRISYRILSVTILCASVPLLRRF